MTPADPLIPEDELINHLRAPAAPVPSQAWQQTLTARLRQAEIRRQRRRWVLGAGTAALLSLATGMVIKGALARLTEALPVPFGAILDGLAQASAAIDVPAPSFLLTTLSNLVYQPLFYLFLAGLLLMEATAFCILQPSNSHHR